jgi:hypothetical protein
VASDVKGDGVSGGSVSGAQRRPLKNGCSDGLATVAQEVEAGDRSTQWTTVAMTRQGSGSGGRWLGIVGGGGCSSGSGGSQWRVGNGGSRNGWRRLGANGGRQQHFDLRHGEEKGKKKKENGRFHESTYIRR